MKLKTIFSIWLKRSVNVLNTKVLTILGWWWLKVKVSQTLREPNSPVFFVGLRKNIGRGG